MFRHHCGVLTVALMLIPSMLQHQQYLIVDKLDFLTKNVTEVMKINNLEINPQNTEISRWEARI